MGEVAQSPHQVLARDVHMGFNKNKLLFVLRSSKTHGKHMEPQMIKISSTSNRDKSSGKHRKILPCPFQLLCTYARMRGRYKSDLEPFFIFADGSQISTRIVGNSLRIFIRNAGFDERLYSSHSLRIGRSCDLYKLGQSVENIKKLENGSLMLCTDTLSYNLNRINTFILLNSIYYFPDNVEAFFDLWILGDNFLKDIEPQLKNKIHAATHDKRSEEVPPNMYDFFNVKMFFEDDDGESIAMARIINSLTRAVN